MDTKYNGWTNHETWTVNLWMDNEADTQAYWSKLAVDFYNDATPGPYMTKSQQAASDLARYMHDEFTDAMPDMGCTVWTDLLSASMGAVEWFEIASSWIEKVEKPVNA